MRWVGMAVIGVVLGVAMADASYAGRRPNIVVILADDIGFSDLGCYGGEINTPHLDALAAKGLRFTQFYNTARCCPTRASLLTGLYAHQAGMGHMTGGFGPRTGAASYAGELSRDAVTLAEALRGAGYATYAVGKWHLTNQVVPKLEGDKVNWPLQRGFERYYGSLRGSTNFFDPGTLVRDNDLISPFVDASYPSDKSDDEGYYYTDAISDHAVRFVDEHRQLQDDRPFFLYMAYGAAHWPLQAKECDIDKYHGVYDKGYDAVRSARLEKMTRLGLIDPRWRIAPPVGQWDKVANRPWEARCMEVYAAMIDAMDQGIGRVVSALDAAGQLEDTLIFYLQDNGACAEAIGRNGTFAPRPSAPTLPPLPADYVQQESRPPQTRDGFPLRQGEGVMPGPADTYIAYGEHWANVSNTPFREYKHWQHEGGISTPLIVHWPARIPEARRGVWESQSGHLIDLMPTCLDAAGANSPREFAGRTIPPMEGVSLLPLLTGGPFQRTEPIFWEHEGNRAIRVDQWKLVAKHLGDWELYDVNADRTESENLATRHPDRVQQMAAQWDAWAARVGVLPWPLDHAR